jgi:hypothetical protein
MLERLETEPGFLNRVITGDESWIYSCAGPGVIKMWRSPPVTNLGYDSASYNNYIFGLTFRDFREINNSITSVDSISVMWRPGVTAQIA